MPSPSDDGFPGRTVRRLDMAWSDAMAKAGFPFKIFLEHSFLNV
jgi:hypothetical protein